MKKFYRYKVHYWQDHYDADENYYSTSECKNFYDLDKAYEFAKSIINDEDATLRSIDCMWQYADWPNIP